VPVPAAVPSDKVGNSLFIILSIVAISIILVLAGLFGFRTCYKKRQDAKLAKAKTFFNSL